MYAMFILIGCSLLIAVGFLAAFFWAVKNGQYDDIYTPSVRILFDDNYIFKKHKNNSDAMENQ